MATEKIASDAEKKVGDIAVTLLRQNVPKNSTFEFSITSPRSMSPLFLVNDTIEQTTVELEAIVEAERHRVRRIVSWPQERMNHD